MPHRPTGHIARSVGGQPSAVRPDGQPSAVMPDG
jgi:hypothetical protein